MLSIVLLAFVASVTADVFVEGPCPDVKTVENFNFNAFGTGVWYELARYPNPIETNDDHCSSSQYSVSGDTINVQDSAIVHGKVRAIQGYAKLSADAGTSGKLDYTYAYGPNGALQTSQLNVLGTDYDNYAVLYYCKYNKATNIRQEISWITSRSKKLEGCAKKSVENIWKKNSFLDPSKYYWSNFSDEACTAKF